VRFTDELAVAAAPAAVFAALADVGRALPCLPGAWVDDTGDAGAVDGGLRVRVGPVTPVYRGTVRVLSADPERRRLVLDARGRDDAGSGPAGARVDVVVVPDGAGTSRLRLDADVVVRGAVARGGRGVLAEVSHDLAARFADQLAAVASEGYVRDIPGYRREYHARRRLGAVAGALGVGALVAVTVVAVVAVVAVRRWRAR
jgi:carbon monoxide dehydrogenase subunit G